MRKSFLLALVVGAVLAAPLAADDYVTVNSFPFPQQNAGANTAITYMQGMVVFLTQQSGYEDVYFLDAIKGTLITQWTPPSPFAVISGLGDDGTFLYAVSSTNGQDKIAVLDTKGTVVTIYPSINQTAQHYGSATDGVDLFVSTQSKRVYRLDRKTGALIQSFTVSSAPNSLFGLAHDTTKLLGVVMNTSGPSTIFGLNDTTGAELFRFPGPGTSGNSRGLGYGDDGNLYVGNQGDNMIYVMAPVPTPLGTLEPGKPASIRITAPAARLRPYVMAASFTDLFGIPLPDGRRIPLDLDALMFLSMNLPSLFQNFQGVLDASGTGLATLNLPPAPALKGLKFGLAFITLNPFSPSGIQVISARRQVEVK